MPNNFMKTDAVSFVSFLMMTNIIPVDDSYDYITACHGIIIQIGT